LQTQALQLSHLSQRRLVWFGAALAVAAYFPRFQRGDGAAVFSAAADCMLQGETPRLCDGVIYAYPPFFALLWTPLVQLPAQWQMVVWYLVAVGTAAASLRLCEALVRRSFPGEWSQAELTAFRLLAFALSLKFVLAVLANQAYDGVAAAFLFLGLLGLISGRSLLGAASLATAAALKVTPVIFLPYLLFKRRFAAAGVFTAVLVALSLLPDILLPPEVQSHIAVWLREVVLAPMNFKPGFWTSDSPMNQSFQAAIVRLFTGVHEQQPAEVVLSIMQSTSFTVALATVMGLHVLAVGCIMLKSRPDDRLIAVEGALLVISALLLSPVSSTSHFIGLALPYALLAAALIKDPSRRGFYAAFLLLSFVMTTATSNDLAGRSLSGWALWNSLPVLGTLILVVPLAVLIWSSRGLPQRRVAKSPASAGDRARLARFGTLDLAAAASAIGLLRFRRRVLAALRNTAPGPSGHVPRRPAAHRSLARLDRRARSPEDQPSASARFRAGR
jgi:alpha-1,2-mannosyltransferase